MAGLTPLFMARADRGSGRRRGHWLRALCWPLGLLMLVACGAGHPEPEAAEYLARLGRVLDADPAPRLDPPGPAWPRRRAIAVEIPRDEIDPAAFIELHACDMGALVGYRNSPLGRTQPASQRLGYAAAWLAAVERCGARAPDWLREHAAVKQAQLPALFWNALVAGDEMRVAAGASMAVPPADLAQILLGFSDQLNALERGSFDLQAFEFALAALAGGSWIGPARKSWAEWRAHLDAARIALDAEGARVCRNGRPTPRSGHLVNVFARFYIGELQPRLAEQMRAHEAWIREFGTLAGRLQAGSNPAFDDWFAHVLAPVPVGAISRSRFRDPRRSRSETAPTARTPVGGAISRSRSPIAPAQTGSEWARTRQAVVEHAHAWQRLFETCGIDPRSVVRQD